MIKLNPDLSERKAGYFFMFIWFAVLIFYLTWDGWIAEWKVCGYAGPNQHFDFDLFDMLTEVVNGNILYYSTNNLHNIIYLCYYTLFFAWVGLLTGNLYFKHTAMALTAFPVIAALFTLNPPDHLYILQIVYDIVHISGIAACTYLFYKNDLNLKLATPGILGTWGVYLLSRILVQPWPFWDNNTLGYFSVNQINNMPFYFYGLEFGIVVIIIFIANYIILSIQKKIPNKIIKSFFPFVVFAVLFVIFMVLGVVELQNIDLGTCP